MKTKLSRPDRGLGLIPAIILFALFLLFIGGVTYIVISAAHGLGNTIHCQPAETNDFSSFSGGTMQMLSSNTMPVPTNITVYEFIERSTNLLQWEPVTNVVLTDTIFDWSGLIDRSQPIGFFRITLYSR